MGLAIWAFGYGKLPPRGDPAQPVVQATPAALATSETTNRAKPMDWNAPQSITRNGDGVFELFTPPAIDYNVATKAYRFKATALSRVGQITTLAAPVAEPILQGVRQADYPLQLTGFVGEGPQARGIFENRESGETLLLQAGEQVVALGLEIAEFKVQRIAVEIPESMTVHEPRASALVRTRAGETVILQQGVIAPGSTLVALITLAGENHELGEGAILQHGTMTYRVGKIRLAPESVAVTKESAADGSTENLVLNAQSPTGSRQPQTPRQ